MELSKIWDDPIFKKIQDANTPNSIHTLISYGRANLDTQIGQFYNSIFNEIIEPTSEDKRSIGTINIHKFLDQIIFLVY